MEMQQTLHRTAQDCGITLEALRNHAFSPVQYAFNGLAGCVTQSRSRLTGTLVGLYNAEQAGLDATAGDWATVCEGHSTVVYHATLATARRSLPDPSGWCDCCREAICNDVKT